MSVQVGQSASRSHTVTGEHVRLQARLAPGGLQRVRRAAHQHRRLRRRHFGTSQATMSLGRPPSVSATSMDNRTVVTIAGLSDSLGRLVPDGTKFAMTAANFRR